MEGIIFPNGYSYLTETIYLNDDKLIKSLKDGKDYVKVTIVDSRGNTSSSIKPLNVEIFYTPYFTSVEATRSNDVDEKVKFKATGKLKYLEKYDVKYIKYWSSESPYNQNGKTEGTEYGPFEIDLSKIVYKEQKSEFSIESLLQGDLGAQGFTKGKKFYIKLAIATSVNVNIPKYHYTNIDDGKYIIVFGPDGIKVDSEGTINSDTLPIGFEGYYPSANPPSNWLIEDGRAVSRTEYKDLFDVIGIMYGEGDGSTTFNLPNKKGKVVVSHDSSQTEFNKIGTIGGAKTHTLTLNQIPNVTGQIDFHGSTNGSNTWAPQGVFSSSNSVTGKYKDATIYNSENSLQNLKFNLGGGGQAHNNLQPYFVEYSIIKAKNSVPLESIVVDSFDSNSTTDALSARKGRELYSITKNKIVASFPIFGIAGDTPVNIDKGSWKDLGNIFYNFKSDIDSRIPLPEGYSRYAQMMLIYTDNCQIDNAATVVGLFDQYGSYKNISFNFERIWGATNNARMMRISTNKVAWNTIPGTWTVFKSIIHSLQQDGGAGQVRYAEMQIVDIKN